MKTKRNQLRRGGLLSRLALLAGVALGVLTLGGCQGTTPRPTGPPPTVDGDLAMKQVATLVGFGPRPSGSAAAKQTVEYLAAQATGMGYTDVRIDTWEEKTPAGPTTYRNLHVILPGSGAKFVVVGSHYDTKAIEGVPTFVGANDSGSSTGLLLEVMRTIKASGKWQGPTLHFMFFDGEEAVVRFDDTDGLRGSKKAVRDLVASGDIGNCRAMLLMDMIGDADLTVTIPTDSNPALATRLLEIVETQGTRKHFGYYLHGGILDDHTPFQKQGVPTLNLIDFNYGPNNSYWHTDQDTLDKLSAKSLATTGNALVALLWDLP